jgi:hypothetical protein
VSNGTAMRVFSLSIVVHSYAPEKIPGLIESSDVELRNQAGETIAVLYEIAHDIKSVGHRIE